MNDALMNMNDLEIGFLHTVLEGGNQQVSSTLEMLTGQSLDQYSVQISVLPATEATALMDFSPEPVVTVICGLQGDVPGDFLFLQKPHDFQTLSDVMSPMLTGNVRSTPNSATDYLIPDWLVKQRQAQVDQDKLKAQMLDTVSELGNMLFGTYLQALYSRCKLAIFQDTPEATLQDRQHAILERAISRNSRETNIAFVIAIDYMIKQKSLQAWLLMLPLKEGLQAMLGSMDAS